MTDKKSDFGIEIDKILAEFSEPGSTLSESEKNAGPEPVKVYASAEAESVERGEPESSADWESFKPRPRSQPPIQVQQEPEGPVRPAIEEETPRRIKKERALKPKKSGQPAAEKGKKAPAFKPESPAGRIIGIVFALISLFMLCWVIFNVHPDTGAVSKATGADSKIDLVNSLNQYVNNFASDALGDLAYIRKRYALDEGITVAPKPNQACYGRTSNPADIQAVIDSASELLEGQEVIWDPNVDFLEGSEIRYYLDDTILVIAWKEVIDDRVCTIAEVRIADGSQLRRKLSEDTYGSSVQMKATDLAKQANSVIAINGDFYAFRNMGITGYQRQIYRCGPGSVDSCFFTADGDMLFAYSGDITTWEDAQTFMDDNDCTFAIAFGPVLIDNGELRWIPGYPIGEVDQTYSRAAIGMLDELHYLLMTVNYEEGYTVTATINELGRFMYDKGCYKAYTLDGGQTSVMVMEGETVNKVDWGIEREMSDIIYFATAIPETEVG